MIGWTCIVSCGVMLSVSRAIDSVDLFVCGEWLKLYGSNDCPANSVSTNIYTHNI